MGKVGKEIVQSRIWMTDAPKPPDANYKEIYPVTVIEAVKESMEEDAISLQEILDEMQKSLKQKQKILPSKPSNHLVTYAGKPGAVGSIAITTKMSWEPSKHSHNKIPTEKAVGDLLDRFGLIDKDGNIKPNQGRRVNWADIIGKPETYTELGQNEDGFVTQKAITDAYNALQESLDIKIGEQGLRIKLNEDRIQNHIADYNNPHGVTADQIDAVSNQAFSFHVGNYNNPHNVTKEQIGLGNVDNTSDENKPLSKASRDEIQRIDESIHALNDSIATSVIDASYDRTSGKLILKLKNGSTVVMDIPINGLIDEIVYDTASKNLVITELSGEIKRVDLSELYIRYIGGTTKNIAVSIIGEADLNTFSIQANIQAFSLTETEIADKAITTRTINDFAVTDTKIKDGSITTEKIVDDAVTEAKLAEKAVTSSRIADRSVHGRALFSSAVKNRLLGVLTENSNPVYLQANADMLGDHSVTTRAIRTAAITSEKIIDGAITTEKIAKDAVTFNEIKNETIIGDNIRLNTIRGEHLIEGIKLPGTPFVDLPPDIKSDGNEIVTAGWVNEFSKKLVFTNKNIGDRIIDGRTLFTSDVGHRVLVVNEKNTDPVWGLITNRMISLDAIATDNIIDYAIISDKIADQAVQARHIRNHTILTDHIQESAITADKIFTSPKKEVVLAVLVEDGHPVYSKVTRGMIDSSAISADQIEDRSITMNKIVTSDRDNRLLGVVGKGTDPTWLQANNAMIADHAINGRTLFRAQEDDVVLGTYDSKLDPVYLKINSNMIKEGAIEGRNIHTETIEGKHLKDESITSSKLETRSIEGEKLKGRTITGAEIFSSLTPNRVLAVSTTPLSDPDWMQVTTDMIENRAITREKIFRSAYYHRVLGASAPGVPPEYIKISSEYIVDYSIKPEKLEYDFLLYGHPLISKNPPDNADNMMIANTAWVRTTIENRLKTYIPDNYGNINTYQIANHAVTGPKLFTSDNGYEVIGVLEPKTDAVYTKILDKMIAEGAIRSDHLSEGILLPENAGLKVRPPADASDAKSTGNYVPDCQWVINAIKTYSGGGGGGGDGTLRLTFSEEHFVVDNGRLRLNLQQLMAQNETIKKLFDPTVVVPPLPPLTGTNIQGKASTFIFHPDFFTLNTEGEISLNFYELFGDLSETARFFGKTLPAEHYGTPGVPIPTISNKVKFNANHFRINAYGAIEINLTQLSCTAQHVIDMIAGTYVSIPETHVDPITLVATGGGGTGGGGTVPIPTPGGGSLTYRSVNGNHLFSSRKSNRVLVVHDANTDAVWDLIKTEMLEDNLITYKKLAPKSVDISKMIGADQDNVVLATQSAGSDPLWIKIQTAMIDDLAVTSNQLAENAVTQTKIRDKAVTFTKLADGPMIDTEKLFDRSVSGLKIQLNTIENDNIKDKTIYGHKIADDIILGGHPTVSPDTYNTYKTRSLRNTIISMDAPSGGEDGDIWIRYI